MGPCKTQGINNVIPLNGKTGRLFSPLYPETFPNNMTCTWIIAVTEGHFVRLRITSFFLAYVCKQTTLEIRDGQKSSSDLLGNFCGSSFERSVFSSGRHLWIRFHSDKDELLYGTGFNAFFEMVGQCKFFIYCCCNWMRGNHGKRKWISHCPSSRSKENVSESRFQLF